MSLKVISDACKSIGGTCTIVLEGDTMDEVTSLAAKQMAMKEANEYGISARGIGGSSGPYMVGDKGDSWMKNSAVIVAPEKIHEIAKDHKKRDIHKFRNDFTIISAALVP